MGLIALNDISKGEELFCDYGYGANLNLPAWYVALVREHVGEEEFQKLKEVRDRALKEQEEKEKRQKKEEKP